MKIQYCNGCEEIWDDESIEFNNVTAGKCPICDGILNTADTDDTERADVMELALEIMIDKSIIIAPIDMPHDEAIGRAKLTIIEQAHKQLSELESK